MSLQIEVIFLYSRQGVLRRLDFRRDGLNVIVGSSDSGKSSLIDIVEYCTGRANFPLEGPLREKVAWYGVALSDSHTWVTIAKPTPRSGMLTQSTAMFRPTDSLWIPEWEDLVVNTNDDGVVVELTKLLGITENVFIPPETSSKYSLEASYRHTSFYLYQDENVIRNKDILFHRQHEDGISNAIRDTLPYLLGAVPSTRLADYELERDLARNLRIIERKLTEEEAVKRFQMTRLQSIFMQCRQQGLLAKDATYNDVEEALVLLRGIDLSVVSKSEINDDPTLEMKRQIESLRAELAELGHRKSRLVEYDQDTSEFMRQAESHFRRLQSIEFLGDLPEQTSCPFCGSELTSISDTVSHLRDSLNNIVDKLDRATTSRSRVGKDISAIRERESELARDLELKKQTLEDLYRRFEDARAERDRSLTTGKLLGQISLFLDSVDETKPGSLLERRAEALRRQLDTLQESRSAESDSERLRSILQIVGFRMSQWANELQMQFANYLFEFDLRHLTVNAVSPSGPLPMNRMGGKSYLGCHLLAMFALHEYFRSQDRPVPGFLFLDQPSQAFSPKSHQTFTRIATEDADQSDLLSVMSFIQNATSQINGLQVILLEHADIENEAYQSSLIEPKWSSMDGLIPTEWLEQNS